MAEGLDVLADMLSYAMDNPAASTTIVLISGSFDLAYPMSILRMRRYHLVLLAPKGRTDRHLKYQAAEYIEWGVPVTSKDVGGWAFDDYEHGESVVFMVKMPDLQHPSFIGSTTSKTITASTDVRFIANTHTKILISII